MFFRKKSNIRGGPDDNRADLSAAVGDIVEDGFQDYAEFSADEEEYGEPVPDRAREAASVPVPDAGDENDEDGLYRASSASREKARRKMAGDDKFRQLVFACACAVAGFCGVASVVLGTAMACKYIASPVQPVLATEQASQPAQDVPEGVDAKDVYYDASGRMHINVYVEKQPDVNVNVRVDKEGNVTAETEPSDTRNVTVNVEEPKQEAVQESAEIVPDEPKTEDELLAEMQARIDSGSSGYTESDVQYTIIKGDTLTKISHETGYSVDFLAAYNRIADKNLIITGETLRYPSFNNSP